MFQADPPTPPDPTAPPRARSAVALETKFQAPAPVASQVLRERLCDAICNSAGQLVLVRAPAGFGKTTAMVQARERLEREGVATVWLTLDRADNDASRFLSGLDEAVTRMGLESPERSGRDAVQSLAQADIPFALFLDEFETVHEAAVLGLVREIAEHLPRRGRLVVGSRSLPPLGLARLRVRGQLTEIDADRLRFTLADATTFFDQRRAQVLSADQLFRLHQKTEGWIAALWLASMALNRDVDAADFVERFSGSNRAVADYLAEEVLARQPPPVRQFLLRTSLLRQLDASVCAALNPRLDCATLLEQLDAEHLFLTPVAGEQRTWRYHSLFADYLRAQLERERPDEVARLHLAASGWYESQGRPVPAIDHAIEGGDFPHAMGLLETHAEAFLEQGRMRLLWRWFTTLAAAPLREHPRLQMSAVWAACFTRGPWEAMDMLERSGANTSDDAYLRAHAASLRPLLLAMQDQNEEALAVGRVSLQRLPSGNHFADSTLLNAMAHITSVAGEPREAQHLLDAARREHSGDSTFNRMYTESTEGLLDLQQGRLRQATARFRLAVDATHAVNYHHTHGNAWAGVLYTSVVYEANQIAQADHLLNVYLPLARDVGLPDHMILSHAMRARIAFINGDVDAASLALAELEYLGHQRKLPRVVAAAKLERARLLLLQGHSAAAHDELVRANDPTLWAREQQLRMLAHDIEYMALARFRWDIAFGDAAACLPTLEAHIQTTASAARQRRLLTLRLLRALALQRTGDTPAAVVQVGSALQFASQEGFMRLVLDEGPALGALVQRYQALHDSGQVRDPLMSDYLQRLLQAFGPLPSEAEAVGDLPGGALEPLTRKEMRVLQLLVEGYSNSAMAEKLYVSDSTVRTHLRNINMKLGAHSRTQAVAIARRLGLVA
ncbi:MAG: LuxR C-terminal-related transcriptional regulator [Hydrogenophaga sp.]|uniref:LuxR C-terminal-related transcriptional regulator n=1 Tax=Hydrogenophaga sp. TaxID=1904254 RepID=UPI00271973DD|nr:LuxR C-terminal-related transcriptional regulator [Hydrogenophaga sp.]MDO9571887.1 LuxR C-terminal-related transcriptional regulator [Hydrogenophaga sp.]MDZ4237596.1 LuxR C-terminal-related transcriptional regulator [Hydrogenophaga sp.]